MSVLAIVLIAFGALVVLFLIGGVLVVRRRAARFAGEREEHILEADRALQQALAADRGWDRGLLEAAARGAVGQARPGFSYDRLDLVLVDDRPGVEEDRAHFVAAGSDGEVRVILARRDGGWIAERVD